MSKEDNLIRETIQELNDKLRNKDDYIRILENKIDKLETDIYFLTRDSKIENVVKSRADEIKMQEIQDSLNQMGMTEDDIEELSDLLDEVIDKGKKDVGNEE